MSFECIYLFIPPAPIYCYNKQQQSDHTGSLHKKWAGKAELVQQ